MEFYFRKKNEKEKNIVTDSFRPGDYLVEITYLVNKNVIFKGELLKNIITKLKKGYQEAGQELMYAGVADTKSIKILVNNIGNVVDLSEMLWDVQNFAQIRIFAMEQKEDIQRCSEYLMDDSFKWIEISRLARMVSEIWRKSYKNSQNQRKLIIKREYGEESYEKQY